MRLFHRLATAFHIYRAAAKNPRMPILAKILPVVALVYLISPIDIIPDFLPVLGQLDDITAIIALLMTAFQIIPKDVKEKARREVIDIEPNR